jgi:hypothetical protein
VHELLKTKLAPLSCLGKLRSLFGYSGKSEINSLILLLDESFTEVSDEHVKKFLDSDSQIVSQTITTANYKRSHPLVATIAQPN